MFKIVITGPESSGKSTLTKELASYFKAFPVEEFSRGYLSNLGRSYTQSDLTKIAKGQIKLEDEALSKNDTYLICDTSLEVIKIWSEFKYQSCDHFITFSLQERLPDLYLLMAPDLPWTPDPLRENPENRKELFDLYKKELISSKVPFHEIYGSGDERFEKAKEIVTRCTF